MHVRAQTGTRHGGSDGKVSIEQVDAQVRSRIPSHRISDGKSIVNNIGMPISGINLSRTATRAPISVADADMS